MKINNQNNLAYSTFKLTVLIKVKTKKDQNKTQTTNDRKKVKQKATEVGV